MREEGSEGSGGSGGTGQRGLHWSPLKRFHFFLLELHPQASGLAPGGTSDAIMWNPGPLCLDVPSPHGLEDTPVSSLSVQRKTCVDGERCLCSLCFPSSAPHCPLRDAETPLYWSVAQDKAGAEALQTQDCDKEAKIRWLQYHDMDTEGLCAMLCLRTLCSLWHTQL